MYLYAYVHINLSRFDTIIIKKVTGKSKILRPFKSHSIDDLLWNIVAQLRNDREKNSCRIWFSLFLAHPFKFGVYF